MADAQLAGPEHMTLGLQLLTNGLMLGALVAVVALGLALVFGVMGVVNFLHAEFITVGGYLTYFLVTRLDVPAVVGVVVAMVVGVGLGSLIQRLMIARVADRSPLDGLLLTYGLSVVALGLITFLFTADYRSYPTQLGGRLELGGLHVTGNDLATAVIAVALLAAVAAGLNRTRIGRSVRAVAQHRAAAAACGVDLRRVDALVYAVGSGLGASAGALLSMRIVTTPQLGREWLLIGFVVVVLGGLGSLVGAVLGGLAVGVLQVVVGFLLDDSTALLIIYLLLFVVLLVRPGGLAGTAEE